MNKLISFFTAVSVLAAGMAANTNLSASAAQSVLLGDANGDNQVTLADVAAVHQYLGGYGAVSAKCFTAMDINQDKMIDSTDEYIIQYRLAYDLPATTVTKELYTLPDDSGRHYIKYFCDTTVSTPYYLGDSSTITSNSEEDENYLLDVAAENYDIENRNVVQLTLAGGEVASGFVVSENVIATAAHCVYADGGYFIPNVTVNIYNENAVANSSNLIATFEAESYHVPALYCDSDYGNRDNYDYALIYVGNDSQGKDLLDYTTAWNFAIPSLEFSEAETGQLTSSGFTTYNNYARFYSTGTVIDFSDDANEAHNIPNLRLHTNADSPYPKCGGPMYYTSTFNTTTKKSVASVLSGGHAGSSWGVSINPTILHFYKQNPYI